MMKHSNHYDGIDPRAIQFIRFHARALANQHAVPGMDVEDYEQELVVDLFVRSRHFDPARASYATFADRIIRNRVSELVRSGGRHRSFSALLTDEDGGSRSHTESLWPSSDLSAHENVVLGLDLLRFIASLTSRFRRCCAWLLADNRRAYAAALGLHRSTLYEAATGLRQSATAAGLFCYLQPDTSPDDPVGIPGRQSTAPGLRVNTTPDHREIARPPCFIGGVGARQPDVEGVS